MPSEDVSSIMTGNVITLSPDQTVPEAADVLSENGIGAAPVVEDGKLVGLLRDEDLIVSEAKLHVPTVIESGLNGTEMPPSWHGMLAPSRTPPAVIAKLYGEIQKAFRDTQMRERITAIGLEPIGSPPEAYRKLVVSNIKRFAELVKIAGVEPE